MATGDRPLVNYIWINRQKNAVDAENPASSIQMGHIKRAFENINKYPEADFQLWVDTKLLDDYTALCLKCFMRDNARHANITLRDLQEIPDYASDPHFVPPQPGDEGYISNQFNNSGPRNVYSRADYARILVLDHCMQSNPERDTIIYSDVDCHDIRLQEALPLIEQHGLAVHDEGNGMISHAYIGLAPHNTDIRTQFKALKSETRDDAHRNKLGYNAFRAFVEALGMTGDTWRKKVGLRGLIPPINTDPPHINYRLPLADAEAWKASRQAQAPTRIQR